MTNETAEPMAMDAAALERETRQILSDYPHTRVEQSAGGWLIGLGWAGIEHVGHTAIDPNTSADPRDLARRLASIERNGRRDIAEPSRAGSSAAADAAPVAIDLAPPVAAAVAEAAPTQSAQATPAAEIVTQPNGAVMIVNLPNDRAEAQAVVRSAISEAKLIRLDAAEQPGWMAELVQLEGWQSDSARRDGGHALPPMTDEQRARLTELWGVRARIESINRHAADLERAARDADLAMLQAMALDVWQGGPK